MATFRSSTYFNGCFYVEKYKRVTWGSLISWKDKIVSVYGRVLAQLTVGQKWFVYLSPIYYRAVTYHIRWKHLINHSGKSRWHVFVCFQPASNDVGGAILRYVMQARSSFASVGLPRNERTTGLYDNCRITHSHFLAAARVRPPNNHLARQKIVFGMWRRLAAASWRRFLLVCRHLPKKFFKTLCKPWNLPLRERGHFYGSRVPQEKGITGRKQVSPV